MANVLDEWYARGKRLTTLQATVRGLRETSWEASILLDEEIPGFIEPLEVSSRDLVISLQSHFQSQIMDVNRVRRQERNQESFPSYHDRIYGTPEDEIGARVDASVAALNKQLKRYVR